MKRGYSDNDTEKELRKVDKLDRSNLLNYRKNTSKNNRVPFVVNYSKGLPDIHKILRNRQKILENSDRLKSAFRDMPIVAFRRDKNLKDILVHKKHNNQFFRQENMCEPCGAKKCVLCQYVHKSHNFQDCKGRKYKIKNYINCKSSNVVYGIFCKKCDKIVYVGETGSTLYQRHVLNLSLIRRQTDDPVATHFYTDSHSVKDYSIIGIEKLYKDDTYRRFRENLWKKKLNTYAPSGINKREHFCL